jgi:hypothetical protein
MPELKFPMKVYLAGVSNYQPAIRKFLRYHPIKMIREPENPYDKNAIMVTGNGNLMGYIPAKIAKDMAPMMDAGLIEKPKFVCATVSKKHTNQGIIIKIERKNANDN